MQFYERVNQCLKENKRSTQWLAEAIDVPYCTVWRWLRGDRKMPVEAAIKISKAIDLPIIQEEE